MSQPLIEDDLSLIYQQLQDIAESLINLPASSSAPFSSLIPTATGCQPENPTPAPNGEFIDEIESLYNDIEKKEKQIHILVEIALSLVDKTKNKIEEKSLELDFLSKNIQNFENELKRNSGCILNKNIKTFFFLLSVNYFFNH